MLTQKNNTPLWFEEIMKYAISREFGIYRFFRPPFNKVMLKFSKVLLSLMPKGMRSGKTLEISKRKIECNDKKRIGTYIIRPKTQDGLQPAILFLHGGGFVFKPAAYHYGLAKLYALQTNRTVIFVDYSLAFETPFGRTLEDCIDAYEHILTNAEALQIDKNDIAFVGDSAGGYLSLSLLALCKERGLPLPKKQMLVYPVVDKRMESESMKTFVDTPCWNAILNRKMWAIFSKGRTVYNPLDEDVTFFPPTYIETAEFDCLHDEAILLAEKLRESAVKCTLNETKGTMHGFDIRLSAPTTISAIEQRLAFLNETF